jgi:type IV pilus assembly protein PilF
MSTTIIRIIITAFISITLAACSSMPIGGGTTVEQEGPNLKDASEINVQLAVGYIQRKQYNAARDKLEKAIEQNPKNLVAYKTLAYLYAVLGLEKEAIAKYDEALDLKPNDPDLLNSYGAYLCSIDQVDEALVKLKEAYSNPFYDSIYLAQSNAGSCLLKQGKYKEAEALLRKSLRTDPNLPGSLISMADIGIKTDRFLMARAYIERYHAVKPASPESLWIQIQAERALGSKDYYMKYVRQLINDFPDSDEAGWAETQARNEQFRK